MCEIGSYHCYISVKSPNFINWSKKDICIDKCIAEEIKNLWSKGIETTGCCCGHGKIEPVISVKENCIIKMKKLGYKKHFNNIYPKSEEFFIAKSKLLHIINK